MVKCRFLAGKTDDCFDVGDGTNVLLNIVQSPYESANDCKVHCLTTNDCAAFQYKVATKLCALFTQATLPWVMQFGPDRSWTLFTRKADCRKF